MFTPYLVLYSDSASQRFLLKNSTCWTIGRDETNTLVIADPWMSGQHALLSAVSPSEFYLIDLESRNGSFINGQRIRGLTQLQHGNRITLAQTELAFFCPPKAD